MRMAVCRCASVRETPLPRFALERLRICDIACPRGLWKELCLLKGMIADMSSLDLAVIGNCAIAALIDRRAQIVWNCFPRFDGDPVFSALLDSPEGRSDAELRGVFAIEQVGMKTCEQAYLENTAVLVSRMSDDSGNVVEITDFAPRFSRYDRTFRPPLLVRRVRPHFEWGGRPPELTRGSNHLRFVGPAQALRLTTDVPVSYVVEERPFLV